MCDPAPKVDGEFQRMRPFLILAVICAFGPVTIPALYAQSFAYQISLPAVTTGLLRTDAIQLQFSAAKILDFPVAPASPVRLQQQSNFVSNGVPQAGYVFSDAVLADGSNGVVRISFQNSAGL